MRHLQRADQLVFSETQSLVLVQRKRSPRLLTSSSVSALAESFRQYPQRCPLPSPRDYGLVLGTSVCPGCIDQALAHVHLPNSRASAL